MPSNHTPPPLDLRWTLSNGLSVLRAVLALPVAYTLLSGERWWTIAISIFAMFTDVADGWLARRLNEVSDLGKILDPLADKVFMAVGVTILLIQGVLPLWFVAIVLGRDLLIFLGGIYIERRTGLVLPSNYPGKAAVVSLSVMTLLLIGGASRQVVDILMGLTLVLLALSFGLYAMRAYRVLSNRPVVAATDPK